MSSSLNTLQSEIANLLVESLNLEDIDPAKIDRKAPLFGDGLGLDSIDALEIGAAISKRYNIKFASQDGENARHFNSIESLAKFVEGTIEEQSDPVGRM